MEFTSDESDWISSRLILPAVPVKKIMTEMNRDTSWVESEEHSSSCEWRWNDKDCGKDLVIHRSKLGVTFHPGMSRGCAAVRGDKPFRSNMEHYFEVELKGPFHGKARQVGIGTKNTALQSNNCDFYPLIGKDVSSWAVNYDGTKTNSGKSKKHVSVAPDKYSIMKLSVLYDSYYGTLAFEVNGRSSGLAYEKIHTNIDMYPMICGSAAGTQMRLVYSSSSVTSLKAIARGAIRMSISKEKDIEELELPTILKSYLLYQSTKTKGSTSRKKHHHSSNMKSQESTI